MKHVRFLIIILMIPFVQGNAQENDDYLTFDDIEELSDVQENDDHLVPVEGMFDIYDYRFDYYSKIRTILFNGLSDSPEIRFLVKPSFTPESMLSIEIDRETGKYYVYY